MSRTAKRLTGGPTFLPDGKRFLYMAAAHSSGTKSASNAIYLSSPGLERKEPNPAGRVERRYSSGYLLTMRDQVLLAQRFDANRGRLAGDPAPLAQDVRYEAGYFRGGFGVSDTGVLVYATGTGSATTRLRWFDMPTGKALGEPFGDPAEYAGRPRGVARRQPASRRRSTTRPRDSPKSGSSTSAAPERASPSALPPILLSTRPTEPESPT